MSAYAPRPFLWREKQVRPDERLDELVADAFLTTRFLTDPQEFCAVSHLLLVVSPAESSQPQTRQGISVDQGSVLYDAVRNWWHLPSLLL